MSGLATFQFDTSIFGAVGDNRVSWGPTVYACNIQVDGFPRYDAAHDTVYPVYFEVTGLSYHYVVQVWSDKVEIEVWSGNPHQIDSLVKRSTILPRNQSELLEALDTVGADFEMRLDALAT